MHTHVALDIKHTLSEIRTVSNANHLRNVFWLVDFFLPFISYFPFSFYTQQIRYIRYTTKIMCVKHAIQYIFCVWISYLCSVSPEHTFQWLRRWRSAYTCSGFIIKVVVTIAAAAVAVARCRCRLTLLLPLQCVPCITLARCSFHHLISAPFACLPHVSRLLSLAFAWKTNQWTLYAITK